MLAGTRRAIAARAICSNEYAPIPRTTALPQTMDLEVASPGIIAVSERPESASGRILAAGDGATTKETA
jgi:hypothetical protein